MHQARNARHRDHRARRAGGSEGRSHPVAGARRGRDPGQGRGGRGEPAGRAAAQGRLSAAARRARTPGLEIAGQVAALGPGYKRYKVGDAVCALVPGGGYAEYCVAAEDNALPVPDGLQHGRGRRASPKPSSRCGPMSSTGPRSSPAKRCSSMADRAASARPPSCWRRRSGRRSMRRQARPRNARPAWRWAPSGRSTTERKISSRSSRPKPSGKGVDVILDMVGGDYVARNFAAAAMQGGSSISPISTAPRSSSICCRSCSSG